MTAALTTVSKHQCDTAFYPNPSKLSLSQINHDIAFLKVFTNHSMKWYLGTINISIPLLSLVSSQINDCQFTFYNKETSSEIHTLLVAALQDLRDSVQKIKDITEQQHLRPLVIHASICVKLLQFFVQSSAAHAHFNRLSILLSSEKSTIQQR